MGSANRKQVPQTGSLQITSWVIERPRSIREVESARAVLDDLRSWHPYQAVLVKAPTSDRAVPPILVKELRKELMRRLSRSAATSMAFILAALLLLFASWIALDENALLAGMAFAFLALVAHVSDFYALRSRRNVAERAAFFSWLSSRDQFRCWLWMTVSAFALNGAIQIIVVRELGGFEPLVLKLGAYFPAIKEGEYWRVLIGPFLHSGFVHWLQNAIICSLLVPIVATTLGGMIAVVCFLAGNALGVVAVMSISSANDALVGVSAGAHALAGVSLFALLALRCVFPKRLWVILLCLIAADYLFAAMNPSTSLVAHMAGGVAGLAAGGLLFAIAPKGQALVADSIRGRRVLRLMNRCTPFERHQ
jgi:membrane associated rhomboid family serine protease